METVLGEVFEPIRSLAPALEYVAGLIDLIGIAIVLWGFVRALVAFIRCEYARFVHSRGVEALRGVRIDLGTYILLGIEFMIASDIIQTVVKRELEDLAFVSALVAIRTAISFFLSREVAEVQREG
jgi:uncharacterized membrane protein